ncbi:MAG TPA: hypothetical protein VFT09_00850, partial [Ilumatobacteraceae bacterium]|nr:hypothetical protein [Ilumatobacteraceae bacterium]
MAQHVKPVAMIADAALGQAIGKLALFPPALTRLEPQSVSGDPRHGADAAVADALWMIGRQWQLGELLGEDVGNPVSVRVARRALPLTAWMPEGDLEPGVAP